MKKHIIVLLSITAVILSSGYMHTFTHAVSCYFKDGLSGASDFKNMLTFGRI